MGFSGFAFWLPGSTTSLVHPGNSICPSKSRESGVRLMGPRRRDVSEDEVSSWTAMVHDKSVKPKDLTGAMGCRKNERS